MKKILSLLLALLMLTACLCACDGDKGAKLISFAQANSVSELKKLDGKKVSIIGYMSTLSPVSGKFMYLMNLPYQSCPFCKPNTNELSNTMAVYAKKGDEFEFTDRAIKVTGIMDFGNYTDEFEYEYGYRIKDATFTEIDTSNMSDELKLWQELASTDVIADVYKMFDYVNFLCFWPTYTAKFESGKDYLYPDDAVKFIETPNAQFNYGFKDDYFDNIIATIKSVDENAFTELIKTVEDAKALSERAYADLKAGEYSRVDEYSGEFGGSRSQYKMNASSELDAEMKRIYNAFSTWLLNWEL